MANIAPEIPATQDPDWLRISKGISDVQPNKTGATAIAGVSNLFKEGIAAVNTGQELAIDEQSKAYEGLNREYIKQLQDTKDKLQGGGSSIDIVPPDSNVPDEVNQATDRAGTLVAARANNKITSTDFKGKVDALFSGIRSQYPGQTKYIDEASSRVTNSGLPANQLRQSLIQDINALAGANPDQKLKSEMITQLNNVRGAPGWSDFMTGVINSPKITPEMVKGIMTYVGKNTSAQFDYNQHLTASNSRDLNKKDQAENLGPGFHDLVSHSADAAFTGLKVTLGIDPDHPDINLPDLMKKLANGEIVLDPAKAFQTEQKIRQAHAEWITSMNKAADLRPQGGGHSARELLGDVPAQIAEGEKRFAMAEDAFHSQNYGHYFTMDKATTGAVTAYKWGFYTQNPSGQTLANMEWLKSQPEFVQDLAKTSDAFRNLNQNVKGYLDNEIVGAASPKTSTNVGTLFNTTYTLRNVKGPNAAGVWAAVKQSTNVVAASSPAEDEVKKNVLRYIFSDRATDIPTMFPRSGLDAQGKPVVNQVQVYRNLTSDDVTKTVERIGKNDSEFKDRYLNFTLDTFSQMVRGEMADLKKVVSSDSPFKPRVSYQNKEEEGLGLGFHLDPFKGPKYQEYSGSGSQGSVNEAYRDYLVADGAIRRINLALGNMHNVAKTFGTDTDTFMLNAMSAVAESQGISKDMLIAVMNAKPSEALKANVPIKLSDEEVAQIRRERKGK